MTEAELRQQIIRCRRITRDQGLLAIIDALEERLNAPPPQPPPQIKFRHNHLVNASDDARIKKTAYMRRYMVQYRKRKKQETQNETSLDHSTAVGSGPDY
jgi:hypothetical protein